MIKNKILKGLLTTASITTVLCSAGVASAGVPNSSTNITGTTNTSSPGNFTAFVNAANILSPGTTPPANVIPGSPPSPPPSLNSSFFDNVQNALALLQPGPLQQSGSTLPTGALSPEVTTAFGALQNQFTTGVQQLLPPPSSGRAIPPISPDTVKQMVNSAMQFLNTGSQLTQTGPNSVGTIGLDTMSPIMYQVMQNPSAQDPNTLGTFVQAFAKQIAAGTSSSAGQLPVSASNVGAVLNPMNTGPASALTQQLTGARLSSAQITAAFANLATTKSPQNINAGSSSTTASVNSAMQTFASNTTERLYAVDEGLSAGDEQNSTNPGAWVMGIGSVGTQKAMTNTSGYVNKLYGAVVGGDAQFNENILAGVAVGYTDTKVFHKGSQIGDRTKIPTWMISLYGMYNFGNNWFTQSTLSYSDSNVHNKSKAVVGANAGAITWGIASGKYHSKSAGIDLVGGYKHSFHDNYSLTPSAGISYSNGRDNGYTETTATGLGGHIFNKKTYNSTSGLFGMRLGYSHTTMNDLTILPEVHANLRTRFKGKDPLTVSRLDGQVTPLTSTYKAPKNSYTIGTSVTAQGKMLDLTVGYDTQLSKKYLGHQGSLKIKVNL